MRPSRRRLPRSAVQVVGRAWIPVRNVRSSETDSQFEAAVRVGPGPDGGAVGACDGRDDGQAQSGAATDTTLHLTERLEKFGEAFRGNSGPGVADCQHPVRQSDVDEAAGDVVPERV